VQHGGMIESVSIDSTGADRLKPNAIGLMGVVFVAVTGAAPISAMLFNVPFATGFGTGLYTPAAFLFATIILTIFTVGYVAMARKMRAAGGFYTFISHGLGRELGLATGITGAIAYSLFEVSLLGGFRGQSSYFADACAESKLIDDLTPLSRLRQNAESYMAHDHPPQGRLSCQPEMRKRRVSPAFTLGSYCGAGDVRC
jgi:hypothetical protein